MTRKVPATSSYNPNAVIIVVTLHDKINPPTPEPQFGHHILEKRSFHPIISFAHVQLNRSMSLLPFLLLLHEMCEFIGHQYIIRDQSTRYKGTLCRRNNFWLDLLQSIRQNLLYYFIQHITETNRSKILHLFWPIHLWDEHNCCFIPL